MKLLLTPDQAYIVAFVLARLTQRQLRRLGVTGSELADIEGALDALTDALEQDALEEDVADPGQPDLDAHQLLLLAGVEEGEHGGH